MEVAVSCSNAHFPIFSRSNLEPTASVLKLRRIVNKCVLKRFNIKVIEIDLTITAALTMVTLSCTAVNGEFPPTKQWIFLRLSELLFFTNIQTCANSFRFSNQPQAFLECPPMWI